MRRQRPTQHLAPEVRMTMLQAHVGTVTAVLDGDTALLSKHLAGTISDLVRACQGHRGMLAVMTAKQLEADARVTAIALQVLAKKHGLDLHELQPISPSLSLRQAPTPSIPDAH